MTTEPRPRSRSRRGTLAAAAVGSLAAFLAILSVLANSLRSDPRALGLMTVRPRVIVERRVYDTVVHERVITIPASPVPAARTVTTPAPVTPSTPAAVAVSTPAAPAVSAPATVTTTRTAPAPPPAPAPTPAPAPAPAPATTTTTTVTSAPAPTPVTTRVS